MLVAFAAAAADGEAGAIAGLGEVAQEEVGAGVVDDGADGDADVDVGSAGAGLILALSRAAVFRDELAVVAEVEEGVDGGVGDEGHIAALAAVAAVGAAARDELLPAEAHAAVAAFAGPDGKDGLVDEHGDASGRRWRMTNDS